MDAKDKERLKKNIKAITDDVDVKNIKDNLIQDGIMDFDDFEEILANPVRRQQTGNFLSKLMTKGPSAYACFRESLQDKYHWLVPPLDNTDVSAVPVRPVHESCRGAEGGGSTMEAVIQQMGTLSVKPNTEGQASRNKQSSNRFHPAKALGYPLFRDLSNNANIKRQWKMIGRSLGVDESDILEIEYANPNQLTESVYQMFQKWQSVMGRRATSEVLYKTLCYHDIPNLEEMFTE